MASKHVFVVGYPGEGLANLQCLLQMAGYRVTAARDVHEAIGLMLNKKHAFKKLDLILMGNGMLFMQFADMFNGLIRLSEKIKILILDDLEMKGMIVNNFINELNTFDFDFCKYDELASKFDQILGLKI